METKLADNIRAERKKRCLTQEQLAEALGVTAGAVYKWESGLSVPELELLVELADFFDSSLDALLGYRMQDERIAAITDRLNELCRSRDRAALVEAEKALKRWPNSFEIVYICAHVFLLFGAEAHDRGKLRRALELLEQARRLLAQNRDPEISELTICGRIADVWMELGEQEKGVDILKENNAGGMFNDKIGVALAVYLRRPEEAEPFLARALLQGLSMIFDTIAGYVFGFESRGDNASAQAIVAWGISFLTGLKQEERAPDFLDKMDAELHVVFAHTQLAAGQAEDARASVEKAAALARRFDAQPDYGLTALRFARLPENVSARDSLGATAAESIETLLDMLADPKLNALWREAAADA